MWDDMDRLGQPAFHERACKVGSSAAPAHLFHDFPRHGQNMRSWSWIGQFLKFHDEFDVWEFGTAWNLSWKNTPDPYFLGFLYCRGGYLCRRWSRFGGLLNQDRHVSMLSGLDISQATWLREHLRDLIPLSCPGWPAKVREASANSVKQGHYMVGSKDRLILCKLKTTSLFPW